MSDAPSLDPARTALLVMDFQRDIAGEGGVLAPEDKDTLVRYRRATERAAEALRVARTAGLVVVHVGVRMPADFAGVPARSGPAKFIRELGALLEGSDGVEFLPPVAPRDGEIVVYKHAVSAFAGTNLDAALRAAGVDTVVGCGIVTHFVVEGTLRDASDRGYGVVTLRDACASGKLARHDAALDLLGFLGPVMEVGAFGQEAMG